MSHKIDYSAPKVIRRPSVDASNPEVSKIPFCMLVRTRSASPITQRGTGMTESACPPVECTRLKEEVAEDNDTDTIALYATVGGKISPHKCPKSSLSSEGEICALFL